MAAAFKNIEDMSAKDILAIPETSPEKLFPPNQEGIKKLFRKLAHKWHPDKNKSPNAIEVFNRVKELNKQAELKLKRGAWHVEGLLEIKQKSGKVAKVNYLKKHNFELGEFYICENKVVYVLKPEFKDLFDNGVKVVNNFEYSNSSLRKQFELQLPKFVGKFEAADGRHVMVVEKDKDMILLRDLLDHNSKKIAPKHVAWMMSRLHNITCYLQHAELTHNAISSDTVFVLPKDNSFKPTASNKISPKDHKIAILGGWWYATKTASPLLGLPKQTVAYAPLDVINKGLADVRTDQSLIRVIGRELLGDITGVKLGHDGETPKALADWLAVSGSGDAMKDFKVWGEDVLINSFGKRRFAEFNVKPSDIYKKPKF